MKSDISLVQAYDIYNQVKFDLDNLYNKYSRMVPTPNNYSQISEDLKEILSDAEDNKGMRFSVPFSLLQMMEAKPLSISTITYNKKFYTEDGFLKLIREGLKN